MAFQSQKSCFLASKFWIFFSHFSLLNKLNQQKLLKYFNFSYQGQHPLSLQQLWFT